METGAGRVILSLALLVSACCVAKPEPDADTVVSGVCAKLVAAGVARGCSGPKKTSMSTMVRFTPTAIAGYDGSIHLYDSDKEFAENRSTSGASADNFPALDAEDPARRIVVQWSADLARTAKASTDTKDGEHWTACMATKPASVCAKAQPAWYGAHKALYEAAKRAIAK